MKTPEYIVYNYIYTERQTGRRYRVVKKYVANGKYAEGNNHRRYELYKQYV